MSRIELTFAGVGGQGSILAAVILGSAVVTHDRKYAVQTQAYSSELRGGFAAAWLIISEEPVVYPRVTHPDILVAQAQDSIQRFAHLLKPTGVLIIDEDRVSAPPDHIERLFKVPATSLSRQELKAPVTANMVMLGALCRVTEVVSREALEQAIVGAVPKGKGDLNLRALQLGFAEVHD
jgi:2-oxoglutarate ferredoxin oxidoreductase subunit gamma